MNWKTLGTGIAIITAGVLPVVPEDMTYLYAYQTTPQAITEATALANAPKAADAPEYLKRLEAPPFFEDDDGNGIISVGVFLDRNGNTIFVRIPDEQYGRMGERNAPTKGISANPEKEEYKSIIETLLIQDAKAAVATGNTSGITYSASGATSYSVSHTTASGDTYLATTVSDWSGDNTTGCTFNSVSMSQLVKETRTPDSGSLEVYLYGLQTPDITTANVVCSRSSSTLWIGVGSVSVSGTDTTNAVDTTATEPGLAGQSSDTLSITTTASSAGVIIAAVADNCNIAASTNATELAAGTGTPGDCHILMRSTNFPEGAAGAYTYTYTFNSNSGHAAVAVSLKPQAVSQTETLIRAGGYIIKSGQILLK